jgi:hypothetical protein
VVIHLGGIWAISIICSTKPVLQAEEEEEEEEDGDDENDDLLKKNERNKNLKQKMLKK